jgi:hypothetical protein
VVYGDWLHAPGAPTVLIYGVLPPAVRCVRCVRSRESVT